MVIPPSFRSTLNRISDPHSQTGAKPEAPLRILVVDDDPDVLSIEAIILQRNGHVVDVAANGEAAWQALTDGGYDLLVTDYTMPGISGLALVRQMREANIMLPVVMVSGNPETIKVTKLSGDPLPHVDALLLKPFTIDDFVSAINRVLGRRSGETESGASESNFSQPDGQSP
jgi:DNA-binding response OmpR family regulator